MQPLLQWKIIKYYIFWLRVYSISFLVWNVHVPYYTHCRLWPVWIYHIFPHYLINGTIFERKKRSLTTKCVFWFPLQLRSQTFLILRRTERNVIINVHGSSCKKISVILFIFYWNLNWLDRISKILKYQISLDPVQWEPNISLRILYVSDYDFPQKPKNVCQIT
jgi:hypothetical protein